MIDLSNVINEDTYIISDTHLGHHRILQYEPVRLEYLADYDTDVIGLCNHLMALLTSVPSDKQLENVEINKLCKLLIPYHDNMLIDKWNSVVGNDKTILHLGDFAFRNIEEYTKKLNGNKILLRGNHDKGSTRSYKDNGWCDVIESVKLSVNNHMFEMIPNVDKFWNGYLTEINGVSILFSHYPIYNSNEWDLKKYGRITNMLEGVYTGYGAQINVHGHCHSKKSVFENAINVSIEYCSNLSPMCIGDVLLRRKN